MFTYIVRRILYSIPVLFLSTYMSFLFVSYAGDPTANIRQNPHLNPKVIPLIIHANHLDVNPFLRYFLWVRDVFTQGFGHSLLTNRAIWPDLSQAMWHSAQFLTIAWVISLVLGCAVGIYSAIKQYSMFDYTFTSLTVPGWKYIQNNASGHRQLYNLAADREEHHDVSDANADVTQRLAAQTASWMKAAGIG